MNTRLSPQEQSILDSLNSIAGNATNYDLSVRLDMPEPSVRRATKSLEDKGRIHYRDIVRGAIVWAANQSAVPAAVAAANASI